MTCMVPTNKQKHFILLDGQMTQFVMYANEMLQKSCALGLSCLWLYEMVSLWRPMYDGQFVMTSMWWPVYDDQYVMTSMWWPVC